jgi:hypothetical protein
MDGTVRQFTATYAAGGVTVDTSFEQGLWRPLYALTAKKYSVLGSSPVMVAEGYPTKVEKV